MCHRCETQTAPAIGVGDSGIGGQHCDKAGDPQAAVGSHSPS
jgi:hypothetical protein